MSMGRETGSHQHHWWVTKPLQEICSKVWGKSLQARFTRSRLCLKGQRGGDRCPSEPSRPCGVEGGVDITVFESRKKYLPFDNVIPPQRKLPVTQTWGRIPDWSHTWWPWTHYVTLPSLPLYLKWHHNDNFLIRWGLQKQMLANVLVALILIVMNTNQNDMQSPIKLQKCEKSSHKLPMWPHHFSQQVG